MKRRKFKSKKRVGYQGGSPDLPLLVLVGFLTLFGWVMVYSSSVIVTFSQDKSPWFYFLRQLIWILVGSIGAYFMYRVNYKMLPQVSPMLIVASMTLLLAVLVIGIEVNGSRRWIRFPFFDLQASEFAKLATIIFLASWFTRERRLKKYLDNMQHYLVYEMLPFLLILGGTLVLVVIEPDLGTTAVIGITAMAMFFLSGEGPMHNIGFLALMFTGLLTGLAAAILEPYRLERVRTYLAFLKTGSVPDPRDSGYQLNQILIAVGSGGLFGVGFGQSRQKFNYLGETAFSDTIFAVIAEEFGLIGATIIAALFLFFAQRGLKIAAKAPDRLSALLAAGITIWLTSQAFFHIAANIGLIPLTGIPLPFISYGGSAMIVTLTATGLLLNISKYVNLNE